MSGSDCEAMPKHERMKLPRQAMPTQDAQARARNFDEVALGYPEETALLEALRCLQCKRPKCVEGCPVEVDIPAFIERLKEGDMPGAVRSLKGDNNLPAICGRVCPQETQCEALCVLGKKHEPVAIGRLERYVADWDLAHPSPPPELPPPTGKKVAVIGCGPAGLTCAGDLARYGHQVTIFESLHAPGGVLIYGIPEFRLPKHIVHAEVDYVRSLGVEIRLDTVIGKTYTLDELLSEQGYDAVFLGTGAGLPMFMHIPGENYNGVYSANEFLTRVNLMKAYLFPEWDTPVKVGRSVAVVGAGNVAMDSRPLRPAPGRRGGPHRLPPLGRGGAGPRRGGPPRRGRGHHLRLSDQPRRDLWRREGLGARHALHPHEAGRARRQRPPPAAAHRGLRVRHGRGHGGHGPGHAAQPPGLHRRRAAWSAPGGAPSWPTRRRARRPRTAVWAGGDIVTGAATVISAMGAGKRAAADIDRFLSGEIAPVVQAEAAAAAG